MTVPVKTGLECTERCPSDRGHDIPAAPGRDVTVYSWTFRSTIGRAEHRQALPALLS